MYTSTYTTSQLPWTYYLTFSDSAEKHSINSLRHAHMWPEYALCNQQKAALPCLDNLEIVPVHQSTLVL